MGLLARLTDNEKPYIGLHGFNSALREYARSMKSKADLEAAFSIAPADPQWTALLSLIDGQTGAANKTIKAIEIGDVLIIRAGKNSRPLYPDMAAIAARFGL
jgi:hypothetical protein